jgi:predicted small lipoprotein YifL
MYFTKAGAVTALAGLGQAFLLPPTIHSADSEIVNTLPFEDAIAGEGMSLRLPCPGCPVVFKDTLGRDIATDIKNQLGLNFEVVHTPEDEEDKLVVNGLQLWPVGISASSIEPLTAPQFIYTDESTWDYAAEPQLGYSIFSQAPILSPDQELYLVKIQLEVIEVGNTFIKGIPAVEISLLRTPSGKLMLGDVMQMEAPAKELTPSDGDQECATALCKWRAILAEKLSSLKGCGRKPLKAPPRPNASVDGPKDHDSRPHRRPHGPHHRHHRNRQIFFTTLRNITVHILLPIAVGVAVGIAASLVGMLVGNLIVLIWRVLFRRNQVQSDAVHQVIIVEESDDETKSFLVKEPQGPPPSYTDEKV